MTEGLESICRVCLTFEGNFYPLQHGLDYLFSQLTGLQAKADDRLPPSLCERCSNELRSYQQFQLTSKQSNDLLHEVLMRFQYVTKHFIETLREENINISRNIKVEETTNRETINFIPEEFKIKYDINSDSDTDLEVIFQSNFTNLAENTTKTDIDASATDFDATATNFEATVTDFDATTTNFGATASDFSATTTNFDASATDIESHQIDVKTKKRCIKRNQKTAVKIAKNDAIRKTSSQQRKKSVISNVDKVKTSLDKRKPDTVKQIKAAKSNVNKDKTSLDNKKQETVNKIKELIKSYFNIKYLTYEEQISNLRKRRECESYIMSPFKCEECYSGFLNKPLYDNHMVRHSDTWGRYQCEICKARYKSKHTITRHIVYGAHNQQYMCKKCDFATGHKPAATNHAQWHQGTSYRCQHCMQTFTRNSSYLNHLRVKHASECVCALCGHNFVNEKGLTQHKSRQHRLNSKMIIDGPTCTTCDIRFVSDDALNTHMRVSPKHVKENKIWSSNYTYKRGMPINESSQYYQKYKSKKKRDAAGPIPCEQCGVVQEDARAYYRHFRRSHPDKTRTHYPTVRTPSMCDKCGRIFQSISHLNHHITRHTGEKPFKCEQCNKRYPSKVSLHMHMKRHEAKQANETFACQMCDKTFTLACNREKHVRFVHSDARPFSCDICGKAFKSKYEKKTHTDYVHLKKPWPKRQRQKGVTAAVRASDIDVELEQLL